MDKQIKVLIADDEQINIRILTKYLNHLNCLVTAVDNGQAVLNSLSQSCFDLLIIDMHMPILDGVETVSSIKNKELCKKMKIYFLTGDPKLEDSENFPVDGIDGVLIKPVKIHKLQDIIASIKG